MNRLKGDKDHTPKVSVIMSVYNDSAYICESVESILNQTYTDFEFIIIDDASTDDTVSVIRGYDDERIRLYRNTDNRGLTANLNCALGLARGEYIARMDGDDISAPNRLYKQVQYLDTHPEVYLVGANVRNIGASKLVWRLPDDSEELRVRMLLNPVFAHPTFMFRRKLTDEGLTYDESYKTAQDYDFAYRVSIAHAIGRVQDILLKYRVHDKQISNQTPTEQFNNADRVRQRALGSLGIEFDMEQSRVYDMWVREDCPDSIEVFIEARNLIKIISSANENAHDEYGRSAIYDTDKLTIVLKKKLYTWVIRSRKAGYILRFPYICGYHVVDMGLFIREITRTLAEKLENKVI